MWDKADLAWCAGLYEGEGTVYNTAQGHLFASISMIDRDVIEEFHRLIRFGRVYLSGHSKASGKEYWRWSTTKFEEVQMTVALFWPWLKERRRAQAKRVLRTEAERVAALPWHSSRSLAMQWFGCRLKDASPAQQVEYRRRVNNRYYARTHPKAPPPQPSP